MSTPRTALLAAGLSLASLCAMAQTVAPQTAAPPSHPAAAAPDAGSTGPTMPPTHPATTGGAADNPSVNGYKQSQPSAEDMQRGKAHPSDHPRQPTSTDSMTEDNKPKHPAAPKQ